MAQIAEDGSDKPLTSSSRRPARGTPEWLADHGHGGGCPVGRCPDEDASWGCPEFVECGRLGCLCEFRSL